LSGVSFEVTISGAGTIATERVDGNPDEVNTYNLNGTVWEKQ
jgi:hypothetical protein